MDYRGLYIIALHCCLYEIKYKYSSSELYQGILQNKARALCTRYTESTKADRQEILRILASQYGVQHDYVSKVAKRLACIEV